MYNLNRNNYNLKPKNSTIYTPKKVSEFIFNLLQDKVTKEKTIFDPCSGQGSLLKPWQEASYQTLANDIDTTLYQQGLTDYDIDFLHNWEKSVVPANYLILCNPPFNGMKGKMAPEVWLDKIIELFGKEIPIVLFVPAGFCANLTLESKRHQKFEQGIYPPISSHITLPLNIFEGVKFHSEILIFNIKGLEPHYFYTEKNHDRNFN